MEDGLLALHTVLQSNLMFFLCKMHRIILYTVLFDIKSNTRATNHESAKCVQLLQIMAFHQ